MTVFKSYQILSW